MEALCPETKGERDPFQFNICDEENCTKLPVYIVARIAATNIRRV
jgi:hypothetical protein